MLNCPAGNALIPKRLQKELPNCENMIDDDHLLVNFNEHYNTPRMLLVHCDSDATALYPTVALKGRGVNQGRIQGGGGGAPPPFRKFRYSLLLWIKKKIEVYTLIVASGEKTHGGGGGAIRNPTKSRYIDFYSGFRENAQGSGGCNWKSPQKLGIDFYCGL